MKLGPATKLDKTNMIALKKLMMTSCQQISSSNFLLITNLEQFRSWIPDAWSVKLKFSVKWKIAEQSNTTFILLLPIKVLFLAKNTHFL